ncbi:MAG: hypothetical protein UHS51_08000 [Atopobiaceae bacterium]|nr:hypothetical protein [Atopobiaceae bacterium]
MELANALHGDFAAWHVASVAVLSMVGFACVEKALVGTLTSNKDEEHVSDDEAGSYHTEDEGSIHLAGLADDELSGLLRSLEAWCDAHAIGDVTFEAPTRAKASDDGTLTVKLRATYDGGRTWVVATRSPSGSWTVEQRPRWADDAKAGA